MDARMVRRLAGGLHPVGLFGLAAWFRLSSLGAMPEPNGDEAIYGVQCLRILAGEPFTLWTPTRHLLDPFYLLPQLPLVALAEPAAWVLRLPAALSGVVAVALAFLLLRRAVGRESALAASALLACLPGAIISSRIGWEVAQVPVVGVVALAFAFRGRGPALLLTMLLGLVVHPTTIFLTPVVLAVYLAVALPRAGDRRRRLRTIALALGASAALVLGYGMNQYWSPTARAYRGLGALPDDWPGSPASLGRFLSGVSFYRFKPILDADTPPTPSAVGLHDAAFWLLVGLAAAGGHRLWRERRRDQLALVAGLVVGVAGFEVVARPDPLWGRSWRYGAFLFAPAALALACLMRPSGEGGRARRAVLFAACWAMLLGVKVEYFDVFAEAGRESIWTFRTEAIDPHRAALAAIEDDVRRNGTGRALVVGGDHWSQGPLEFLASDRDGIGVVGFGRLGPDPVSDAARLRARLDARAYVVELADRPLEAVLRTVAPGDQLRRWDVAGVRGRRYLSVYRLRRPDEPAAVAGRGGDGLRR